MNDALIETRPLTLEDWPQEQPVLHGWGGDGAALIQQLLGDQHKLSAVELFAQDHDSQLPDQARYYARLLPTTTPGPGQQYGFEVDLDRCSGCKACVTACHALNGLDEKETWRDVGLLIGGTASHPVMQHVTSACHHCVEPACMIACPVNAYEKDAVTGIVRHLDDQCFGCQYCTLACPYNVPKYHSKKGIVRKCDMCSNRLAHGEAPACVQACPHEAIAIHLVDIVHVIENAETGDFLPAAPEPHLTLPTTTYHTKRVFPRNMLPADYYSISPQHPHWPLIIMLVMTQLSVGAFATGCVLEQMLPPVPADFFRPFQATIALLTGLLALGASTLHLGRPLYAFRGVLGLRHSWLSREIFAFGIFAGLAVPYAGLCWLASFQKTPFGIEAVSLKTLIPLFGWAVTLTGTAGVFCSAMIYVFTRRELWNLERTTIRFGLTTALLGIATTWFSLSLFRLWGDEKVAGSLLMTLSPSLARSLVVVSILKIGFDVVLLRHLTNFRNTPLKRSALLVVGALSRESLARLVLGMTGGIVLPGWMLSDSTSFTSLGIALVWIFCLAGELFERFLFFAAVSALRMPGGVRP